MKKFLRLISNRRFQILFLSIVSVVAAGLLLYANHFRVMPQNAAYFLSDVQLPSAGQKLMIFTPHPDDETLGAGGYISQSVKNGAVVQIVLVTDGNKHGLKDKRYEEFKNTTSILGAKEDSLVFLNYHDGDLKDVNEGDLSSQFKEIVNAFQPNYIVSPDAEDTHPDHAATGRAVNRVMSGEKSQIIDYQYLIHYNKYPEPKKKKPNLYLLPPVSLVRFDSEWKKLSLTPETESTKEVAIEEYRSQLKNPLLRPLLVSFIRKNELFIETRGGI